MTEKIYLQKCSKVQFVIDAVYAFAFALQKMKNQLCPRHRGTIRIFHNTDISKFIHQNSNVDMVDKKYMDYGRCLFMTRVYLAGLTELTQVCYSYCPTTQSSTLNNSKLLEIFEKLQRVTERKQNLAKEILRILCSDIEKIFLCC